MNHDSQNSIFRRESLERLSSPEQLDQLMQVVNSRSWLALGALGALVSLTVGWSIWGRIPIMAAGKGILVHPTNSSQQLVDLAYVAGEAGYRIQPGMQVMIVPDRFGSESVGGILGRVKSVSAASVTTLEAARQSDDAYLKPSATEVIVELETDASTVSGYRWSSPAGRQVLLSPGMITTAHITLTQKAPITFAFPFLEAKP
jgi:hypothetical protein